MRIPAETAASIARYAAQEAMGSLTAHVDAHPLRYGRLENGEEVELRERIEHGFAKVLAGLEVTER